MNSLVRRKPALALAALVCIACLTGAWAVAKAIDRHDEVRRDSREVKQMTATMKTVCVGRFLIDMPVGAEILLDKTRINGLDIVTYKEPREQFLANLAARQEKIESTPDRHGGLRNMESATDVATASGLEGKIFMHTRRVTEGTRARGLELEHYRYEGMAIEAMVHGEGVTIELSADNYDLAKVAFLPRLVQLILPNPEGRPPSMPGFCADMAFFRDVPGQMRRETIMMMARLPAHPDIDFTLIHMGGLKPGKEGLLARRAGSSLVASMLALLRLSTLRASTREIAGIEGDEVAERVSEQGGTVGYSFEWAVNGNDHDLLSPHLSFLMSTGNGDYAPVQSSLTEDAALALWDKVVSSIRHHSVAAAPVTASVPPPAAMGMRMCAGEQCVQGGWWQCSDGGNGVAVLGGRSQYFRQGERMPQALLLPSQGLWQRLRGLQPSFESATPTVWRLVDRRERDRTPAAPALVSAGMPADSGSLSAATGAVVPGGTIGVTGSACPASGWWRCEDQDALDGVRWFAVGSLLPPATFARVARQLGRMSRPEATTTRRTVWTLMRQDGVGPL